MAVLTALFLPLLTPSLTVAEKAPGAHPRLKVGLASFEENEKERYKLKVVQPYSFDLKTIQKSMASLGFQGRAISWSGRRRVFRNSVIKSLGPMILKKFAQANSSQRIIFKVLSPLKKTLILGDTFLTPQGLHWRFTVINRSKRKIDDFSVMGDTWKLAPRKGQSYKKRKRKELNDLVQDMTNWVVFDKIRPAASRIIKTPTSPASVKGGHLPASPGLKIKERLRVLKELREEELINEEEYQSKRREILKDF